MRIALLLIFLSISSLCRADVFFFGDSLTDTGNVPILPPYYQGRFSNGPNWADFLAEGLGFPSASEPAREGDNNYAVGGAEAESLSAQYLAFLFNEDPTSQLDPDDLCVIWIGGNDLLNGEDAIPSEVADLVRGHIDNLHNSGARRILLNNVPDLSQIPGELGTPNSSRTRSRTMLYNLELARIASEARSELNIEIIEVDIFGLFELVYPSFTAFGFTNITEAAFDDETIEVVENPDGFVFWDEIHPTTRTHELIGRIALQAVTNDDSIISLNTSLTNGQFQATWILRHPDERIVVERLNSQQTWETEETFPASSTPAFLLNIPISNATNGLFRIRKEDN